MGTDEIRCPICDSIRLRIVSESRLESSQALLAVCYTLECDQHHNFTKLIKATDPRRAKPSPNRKAPPL